MSSRGYLVDMVESIGEKICLTSHIQEMLRASDEFEDTELKEILEKTLELRRAEMSDLLDKGENPDPRYHCAFKHALGSFMRDVEIYEATSNEKDLARTKESANLLAMVMSKYLGMEFENCARCLWDRLLVQQKEKEAFAIINSNEKGDENGE